jgi:hypothetical protein
MKGMLPKKEEIYEKAVQMWFEDQYRQGLQPTTNPEPNELREGGYLSSAQSELMTSIKTKNAEWLDNSKDMETLPFQFDTQEGMTTTSFVSGSRGVGKSDICMRIVDKLKNEGIVCIVFDPSTDWIQRSSLTECFTVKPYSDLPIPETSTLFDISQLTPIAQQRIVETFCKKLFESQLKNSAKRFYLVFEEAQIFFPLNSLRSLRTQNTMRILTTGRNFGVSLCAISQFAATIDKELVKNAGQIFLGYSSELNTLAYWKGILGKKAEDLKTLQNGQFVYFNRNKISLIESEPYESQNTKTQIVIPQSSPIEPIKPKQETNIATFLRLGLIVLFIALLFGVRR